MLKLKAMRWLVQQFLEMLKAALLQTQTPRARRGSQPPHSKSHAMRNVALAAHRWSNIPPGPRKISAMATSASDLGCCKESYGPSGRSWADTARAAPSTATTLTRSSSRLDDLRYLSIAGGRMGWTYNATQFS